MFIGNFDIYSLTHKFLSDIFCIILTDSDPEKYRSLRCQTHYDLTDKSNDISFEGLDRHYR